ncbi:unnamed protein product, partial [marine sediment metagenome]
NVSEQVPLLTLNSTLLNIKPFLFLSYGGEYKVRTLTDVNQTALWGYYITNYSFNNNIDELSNQSYNTSIFDIGEGISLSVLFDWNYTNYTQTDDYNWAQIIPLTETNATLINTTVHLIVNNTIYRTANLSGYTLWNQTLLWAYIPTISTTYPATILETEPAYLNATAIIPISPIANTPIYETNLTTHYFNAS